MEIVPVFHTMELRKMWGHCGTNLYKNCGSKPIHYCENIVPNYGTKFCFTLWSYEFGNVEFYVFLWYFHTVRST